MSLSDNGKESLGRDVAQDLSLINEFARLAEAHGDKPFADMLRQKLNTLDSKAKAELGMSIGQ